MLRIDLRRAILLAVCALLCAAPARAGASTVCPRQPVAQVFLPWGDLAWYASVPDGGMELRAGAWRLSGGAAIVPGNEPYHVRANDDAWSLALPSGASAASRPACIAPGHPTIRFFLRNTGARGGTLQVSVEYTDMAGVGRSLRVATLAGRDTWQPSPALLIVVNALPPFSAQNASFRFTAAGSRWQIDDVYVDPYGKG